MDEAMAPARLEPFRTLSDCEGIYKNWNLGENWMRMGWKFFLLDDFLTSWINYNSYNLERWLLYFIF